MPSNRLSTAGRSMDGEDDNSSYTTAENSEEQHLWWADRASRGKGTAAPSVVVQESTGSSRESNGGPRTPHLPLDRECTLLLLENRSYGHSLTDGTVWSNFLGYTLQRHPLLSIFAVHPLHPYTRSDRVVVLVCSFCYAFFCKAFMHREPLADASWLFYYAVLLLVVIPFEVLIRVIVVCPCLRVRIVAGDAPRGPRTLVGLRLGRASLYGVAAACVLFIASGVYTTVHARSPNAVSLMRQSLTTVAFYGVNLLLWPARMFPLFIWYYGRDKALWVERHLGAAPRHGVVSSADARIPSIYRFVLTGRPSPQGGGEQDLGGLGPPRLDDAGSSGAGKRWWDGYDAGPGRRQGAMAMV